MKRKYILYISKNEKYPGVRNLNDLKKIKTKDYFHKFLFENTCLVMMKVINILK